MHKILPQEGGLQRRCWDSRSGRSRQQCGRIGGAGSQRQCWRPGPASRHRAGPAEAGRTLTSPDSITSLDWPAARPSCRERCVAVGGPPAAEPSPRKCWATSPSASRRSEDLYQSRPCMGCGGLGSAPDSLGTLGRGGAIPAPRWLPATGSQCHPTRAHLHLSLRPRLGFFEKGLWGGWPPLHPLGVGVLCRAGWRRVGIPGSCLALSLVVLRTGIRDGGLVLQFQAKHPQSSAGRHQATYLRTMEQLAKEFHSPPRN